MDQQLFQEYHEATSTGNARRAQRLLSQIIVKETPFIYSVAKKFAKTPDEYPDLLQAGRMGLLGALRNYDPSRGNWSPYAWQWCSMEMNRQVCERRPMIRGCTDRKSKMPKSVRSRIEAWYARTGEHPTPGDLSLTMEQFALWRDAQPIEVYMDGVSREDICAEEVSEDLPRTFIQSMCRLTSEEQRIFLKNVFQDIPLRVIAKEEGLPVRDIRKIVESSKAKLSRYTRP